MPDDQEYCEITVDGKKFRDWESVNVQVQMPGKMRSFTVSISEDAPSPTLDRVTQISPGARVQVHLAGIKAIDGFVYERQTVMDANTHAVQITGQSHGQDLNESEVDYEKLPGKGQFQNKSLVEITKEICKPYGISLEKITGGQEGMNAKIKDAQVTRGETAFQFLERLARPCAVHIGDTVEGNLWYHGVANAGLSGGGGDAALVEGKNIQAMRLIVNDSKYANTHTVTAQGAGDDKDGWGKKASQRQLREPGPSTRYKPAIWQLERGFSSNNVDQELKWRMAYERTWKDGTYIQGEVTVYGWLKPGGGGLWPVGPDIPVYVHAPSAMVTQVLWVKGLTFSQDNARGTLTTLNLVVPKFYDSEGTGTLQAQGRRS
jgi:prophage tail gpP-like protein